MTPRRAGLRLATIFGIDVSVGLSWFVVVFAFILIFTPSFHEVLGGAQSTAYAVAVASVLGLFLALLLHELGHAVIAKRNGVQVAGIELWALGGITRTSGTASTPGGQLAIAAAGPLVTLAIAAVCVAVAAIAYPSLGTLEFAIGGAHPSPVGVWLQTLAAMNLLVLVLNLIPAFPLDGGQIAQALVWWKTGDRNRAMRATGRVGQGFALLIGGLGLYLFARGQLEGVWLLFIALTVYQGAGAAVVQGSLGEKIGRLTVADVMDREPITIPAGTTLLDAQEQFFTRYHWPWFAVVDSGRRFLGVVRQERIDAELAAGRPALSVLDALEEDIAVRIGVGQPLESLLRSEALSRLGGMVAVDGDGTLRGVVTLAQVRQALRPAS